MVTFGVLGPLTAANEDGPVDLKGPRHRAVLARLLVARGRVVPMPMLIDDLWVSPPKGAVGAVQTFVGALRKALEPARPPRTPSRLLVTEATGYALHTDQVDALRFTDAVTTAATSPPTEARDLLDEALGWWRGPAYTEFADEPWARGEVLRLTELRLLATERRAEAALATGHAADEVPGLAAHVQAYPLRENGWRLLALAQYRAGRQGDALATLRRARTVLRDELGVDPGEALARLEADMLAQAPHLTVLSGRPQPGGRDVGGWPAAVEGLADGARLERPRSAGMGYGADGLADGAGPGGSFAGGFAGGLPAAGGVGGSGVEGFADGAALGGPRAGGVPGSGAVSSEARGFAGEVPAAGGVGGSGVEGFADGAALGGSRAGGVPGSGAVSSEAGGFAGGMGGLPAASGVGGSGTEGLAGEARLGEAERGSELAPREEVAGGARSGGWAPGVGARLGGAAGFVGRVSEMGALLGAAGAVQAAGRAVLALVAGEAGAGKTALVSAVAARLGVVGWTVQWVACPEVPGTPVRWPWPSAVVGRGRWLRAVLAHLASVVPVVVVLDDLQWADEDTLALLTTLSTAPGAILVVGTYRPGEVSSGLAAALARAARVEPVRVGLGGLSRAEVAELLAGAGPVREIHERSGGNPFFVRELARLWAAQGNLAGVPAGVRDVIRHRLGLLAEPVRTHVRVAAVAGADVDLLAAVTGEDVLDSLETAVGAGFLVEDGGLRFAHDLVRQALYEDIARVRRVRWHAAVADVLQELRPGDVSLVAHHLVLAEDQVPAARVAHYTRAAAEIAPPREAVRLWRATVSALADDDVARLSAEMGLVRSLAVSGDLVAARRQRAATAAAAEALGDPLLTARVLGAFDVPAVWTTSDDEQLAAGLAVAAERTLVALPAGHDADRARLLATIATERRADPGPRALAAAREAEAIARRLGDSGLLAWALNGRYLQTCYRAGLARERAEIGAALLELDTTVPFTVLGHLILVQCGAALADLPSADRHAAAADVLAARYDLPLVGVFTDWYRALRLAITGDHAAARPAYAAAAARLAGAGMPGVADGLLPLALLSVGAPPADADWGPYEPWVRPEAAIPESPPDLLLEVRLCLHARSLLGTGDPETVARVYAALSPAADELAAGSGLVSLGPVAGFLAGLADMLDLPEEAAAHRETAAALTRRVVSERQTGY